MRDPPSYSGGCHDNLTWSAEMSSTTSGPTGLLGLSAEKNKHIKMFYCDWNNFNFEEKKLYGGI